MCASASLLQSLWRWREGDRTIIKWENGNFVRVAKSLVQSQPYRDWKEGRVEQRWSFFSIYINDTLCVFLLCFLQTSDLLYPKVLLLWSSGRGIPVSKGSAAYFQTEARGGTVHVARGPAGHYWGYELSASRPAMSLPGQLSSCMGLVLPAPPPPPAIPCVSKHLPIELPHLIADSPRGTPIGKEQVDKGDLKKNIFANNVQANYWIWRRRRTHTCN